jgi:hypothetical protein
MRRYLRNGLLIVVAMFLDQGPVLAADRPDWNWLVVCDGPQAEAERAAIVSALRLLPRLPARVAVIDVSEAKPEVRQVLLRLDAFITRGSPVVYVVKQSALLHGAVAGSALHTHALAAVLWHEMAHADGADERDARKREEALWASFIRDARVDAVVALRYLKALHDRPDDLLMAAR